MNIENKLIGWTITKVHRNLEGKIVCIELTDKDGNWHQITFSGTENLTILIDSREE